MSTEAAGKSISAAEKSYPAPSLAWAIFYFLLSSFLLLFAIKRFDHCLGRSMQREPGYRFGQANGIRLGSESEQAVVNA